VEAFVNPITGTLLGPALCPGCEAAQQAKLRQAEETARARQRQHRQANIQVLLARAGVPPRYQGCSLENYQGNLPPERPVMLLGAPGTGKTHLAVAYLREWMIAHGDTGAWFCRVLDLLRRLRRGYEVGEDLVDRLGRETGFLVLDDLGTEMATDFALQNIYDIVDLRYAYGLPLVITSNLEIRKIGELYGTNFLSRLQGMGEVVQLNGPDHRLRLADARQQRKIEQNMH